MAKGKRQQTKTKVKGKRQKKGLLLGVCLFHLTWVVFGRLCLELIQLANIFSKIENLSI